ncbi:MAG: thiamine phosphate synthase [Nitrospirota bacterium]
MPSVDFRLYLLTDRLQTGGRPLVPLLSQAIDAGVSAVQLRERDLGTRALLALAQEVHTLTRERGAKLFINDRVDLVNVVEAAGVHLRASSLPVAAARRILGPERLIGVSTHSADEAVRAEADGADFAVLGPIYDTPSKRGYGPPIGIGTLEDACRRCRIPVFAIGGITPPRASEVRRAGAFGVAVISAVLGAEDVGDAVRRLANAVTSSV